MPLLNRLLLVAALFAGACTKLPHDNPYDPDAPESVRARARLVGVVTLESGQSSRGVDIIATATNDEEQRFNAQPTEDGGFTLELPSGTYNVTLSLKGYASMSFTGVTLSPGQPYNMGELAMTLSRGSMTGEVRGDSPSRDTIGIAGAQVTLVPTDGNENDGAQQTTFTSDGGRFRVDGVPEGSYLVRATAPDFAPGIATEAIIVIGRKLATAPVLTLRRASAVVVIEAKGVLGAQYTNDPNVTVHLLSYAPNLVQMRLSEDKTFKDVAFVPIEASTPVTLADADGAHTIYAQFQDQSGTESPIFSAAIVLDRDAPLPQGIAINDGALFLGEDVATVTATAKDELSGVRGYVLSLDGTFDTEVEVSAEASGSTAAISTVESFLGGDGPKEVAIRWIDRAGNVSAPETASIEKDVTPPSIASFTILETPMTKSETVTLQIDQTGASEMLLSNFADFFQATWQPVSATRQWDLRPNDGTKRVHLMLRDAAGNATSAVFTETTLDQTPAAVRIGIGGFFDGLGVTTTRNVTLSLLATDQSGTGAMKMFLSEDSQALGVAGPTAFVPFDPSPAFSFASSGDGTKFVFGRFIDAAGNITDASNFIQLDTTGPVGTVSAAQGSFTNSASVDLVLFSAGADAMKIEGDVMDAPLHTTTGNYVTYAPTAKVRLDLSSCVDLGDCQRTVRVTFRDVNANPSSSAAVLVLTYDQVAPTTNNSLAIVGTVRTPANVDTDSSTISRSSSVALRVTSDDGVRCEVADSLSFAGAGSFAIDPPASQPTTILSWLLLPPDGADKKVYARFVDRAGNTSAPVSASIALDTTPPARIATTPSDPATILQTQAIVVDFSEPLDPATLVISGSMGPEAALPALSVSNTRVTLTPSGTWSDGTNRELWIDARDAVGNDLARQTLSYNVDATPPALTSSTPATTSRITTTRAIRLQFSEEMNPATLVLSGSLASSVSTKTWSQSVAPNDTVIIAPSAWPTGAQTLVIDGTDAIGNALPQQTVSFFVDGTAPTLSTTAPANGARVDGTQTIVLTFSEPMQTSSLVLTGTLAADVATATFNGANTVLTLTTAAWTPGTGTLNLSLTDVAGNPISPVALTYIVDVDPPVVTLVTPADGSTLHGTQPIVIDFSEAMNPASLVTNPASTLDDNGFSASWSNGNTRLTYNAPLSRWPNGAARTLTFTAADTVGNAMSASATLTFDVDSIAPTLTAAPVSTTRITTTRPLVLTFSEAMDQATLVFTGSLAAQVANVTWSAGDTVATVTSAAWNTGAQTLIVNAKDAAGNALAQVTLSYPVDGTAPSLVTASPADGATIASTQDLVLRFSESMNVGAYAVTGSLLQAGLDPLAFGTVSQPNDRLTLSALTTWPSGTHSVTIDAADLAGNALSPLTLTFTVDTTAPTISAVAPADGSVIPGAQPIVIDFDEAMASLTVDASTSTLDNGAVSVAWSNGNTRATVTPSTVWTNGAGRTLVFDATDAVGNALGVTTFTYDVDAIAPTVTTATPAQGASITNTRAIVVQFSEPIDPLSLVLTGSMAAEDDGGTWNATFDQLTVLPAATWSSGAATFSLDARDVVGNALSAVLSRNYTIDSVAPVVLSVSPVNGARIDGSMAIVIRFSESMNSAAFTLGGSMAAESGGGVWSQTATPADTLTVAPAGPGGWTESPPAATLTFSGADVAGNTIAAPVSLSYTVDETPPTASAAPASGLITGTTPIVITFSEPVDQATLTASGTLLAATHVKTWSNGDQTLTLSPTTSWATGSKTLTISVNDVTGLAMTAALSTTYTVDLVAPTVTVAPVSGSTIDHQTAIVLTYSESMQSGAFGVSGALAASSDGGTWGTSGANPSDRLTLAPTTGWPTGANKTLVVTARDVAGNLVTSTLSYGIVNGVLYVDDAGSDTNPGTADAPMLSIRAAVTVADTLYTTASVHVAEGTYQVSSQSSTHLVMTEGISVLGGYKDGDWSTRDPGVLSGQPPTTHRSVIASQTSGTNGDATSPARAVSCGANVTTATLLEGFVIEGGGGDFTAAIACLSATAPTIRYNAITGGVAIGAGSEGYGVFMRDASPVLTANTISGAGGQRSFGVHVVGAAAPTISANTEISGGNGTSEAHGLYVGGTATATISNNTIRGADAGATSSYGVSVRTGATATLTGNTITAGNGTTAAYGVHTTSAGAVSVSQSFIDGGGGTPTTSYGIFDGASAAVTNSYTRSKISGGAGTTAYGVFLTTQAPRVVNNWISGSGAGATTTSYGVYADAADPFIFNNTIDGGSGSATSTGIVMTNNSDPVVANNIVFTSAGTTRVCLREGSTNSDPNHLLNNEVFGCPTLYVNGNAACPGANCFTAIADLNDRTKTTVNGDGLSLGNTNEDPTAPNEPLFVDLDGADNDVRTLADNDWRLHTLSPKNVRRGGVDGTAPPLDNAGNAIAAFGYSIDRTGVTRTAPWSLGADEEDRAPKIAFVTSTAYDGDLGGVLGADALCASHAGALSGTFRAWIADGTSQPSTAFSSSTLPYARVDNVKIADDSADLFDGTLDNPLNLTETGALAGTGATIPAWTNVLADGTPDSASCADWLSNGVADNGALGNAAVTSSNWTDDASATCDTTARIFCFEQ